MAGLINFEDEKEVKQFLDNLGVEYSFQCYNEKDPEGRSFWAVHRSVVLKHMVVMQFCFPHSLLPVSCF